MICKAQVKRRESCPAYDSLFSQACVEKSSLSRVHVCRKVSNDQWVTFLEGVRTTREFILSCRYRKDVVYIFKIEVSIVLRVA